VVTLLAHGCPVQAIVAAFEFDERTIADWWARVGRQGQAVHESLVNSVGQNVFFYKLSLDTGPIAPKR
jgi:hypothetical protein